MELKADAVAMGKVASTSQKQPSVAKQCSNKVTRRGHAGKGTSCDKKVLACELHVPERGGTCDG